MHVCLDIQASVGQRAGIGTYTRELATHLGYLCNQGDELSFTYFDFKRSASPPVIESAHTRAIRCCPGRLANKAWQMLNWPPFNWFAGNADLYHFPNFVAAPVSRGKTVVTIHDMSFMRLPQFAESRNLDYLNRSIRKTVERADAIITDSHFSAGEIQELLDVEQSKLFPIHLGINDSFCPQGPEELDRIRSKYKLDRPYLFTLSTIEPRKNIPFLIDVFERLNSFDGFLVVAGAPGWKCDSIMERMSKSPRSGSIKYLRHVSLEDARALYAGSELFLFPSFYEGFGFPPLEAMACGTPVITARGGSLEEVVGPGAITLGYELDEWIAETQKVLTDGGVKRALTANGAKHVKQYKWTETARRTWDVYRRMVDGT